MFLNYLPIAAIEKPVALGWDASSPAMKLALRSKQTVARKAEGSGLVLVLRLA